MVYLVVYFAIWAFAPGLAELYEKRPARIEQTAREAGKRAAKTATCDYPFPVDFGGRERQAPRGQMSQMGTVPIWDICPCARDGL